MKRHSIAAFVTITGFCLIAAGCSGSSSSSGSGAASTTAGAVTGSATLTWTAPTLNTDESALTDLGGYKVYYGTSAGSYSTSVDVGNVTTYTVSNLSAGTYYFSVKAYDQVGNESTYATEVSKTIQ